MPELGNLSNEELWEVIKSPDLLARADAQIELGHRARLREDWNEAGGLYGSASAIYAELGKPYDAALATYSLGYCQHQLEDFAQAIENLEKSLAVGRDLNDAELIGCSAGTLGDALNAKTRPDEAVDAYELAAEAYANAEENFYAGLNRLNAGELHGQSARQTKALESFLKAYNHFQLAGDHQGSARSKDRMASALIELGDYEQALAHLQDSLKVFEFIEDMERVAFTNYRIGWTQNLAGNFAAAEAPLRKAIAYFRSEKHWSRTALVEKQLCDSLIFREPSLENAEAAELLPRVISYFEAAGEQPNAIAARAIYAVRAQKLKDFRTSRDLWLQLLDDCLKLGDPYYIRQARLGLAESLASLGMVEDCNLQLQELEKVPAGENKIELDRLSEIRSSLENSISGGNPPTPKASRKRGKSAV